MKKSKEKSKKKRQEAAREQERTCNFSFDARPMHRVIKFGRDKGTQPERKMNRIRYRFLLPSKLHSRGRIDVNLSTPLDPPERGHKLMIRNKQKHFSKHDFICELWHMKRINEERERERQSENKR